MSKHKKTFYISTPIYYSSGKPHIGHACSTIIADVIAKYKAKIGYEVFMQTGMDEHGQKIEEQANKLNVNIQDMIDENAKTFKSLFKKLNIDFNYFIRTSDNNHKEAVRKTFTDLFNKKLIYLDQWKDYYCVSCEESYSEKDIIKKDGKLFCKLGHEITIKNEPSYFLKLHPQFDNWIKTFYQNNPELIIPKNRYTEIYNNFIKDGLLDLSITRTKVKWGISINENQEHTIYVWLDALLNYITSLGFNQEKNELFNHFWNNKDSEIVHVMSKEITRFHCIYWPIILEMLAIKKPTNIIAHGWIITKEGKMSKSLGNVIDPMEYVEKYSPDAFRYFMMKDISISKDSTFDHDTFIETINTDLANNFGNLITRTNGMIKKYNNYIVPELNENKLNGEEKNIIELINKIINQFISNVNSFNIKQIINDAMSIIDKANKFVENTKPWELFKNNKSEQLNNFLNIMYTCCFVVNDLLSPILNNLHKTVSKVMNFNSKINFHEKNIFSWSDKKINESQIIFQRIEK